MWTVFNLTSDFWAVNAASSSDNLELDTCSSVTVSTVKGEKPSSTLKHTQVINLYKLKLKEEKFTGTTCKSRQQLELSFH